MHIFLILKTDFVRLYLPEDPPKPITATDTMAKYMSSWRMTEFLLFTKKSEQQWPKVSLKIFFFFLVIFSASFFGFLWEDRDIAFDSDCPILLIFEFKIEFFGHFLKK